MKQPPQLFISYSWSTPSHEQWVLNLAADLCAAGIGVILDKWDLREGHDAHAFMERMVTDRTVTKVALVCDRAYVEKADSRTGGVGTETQIITPELYAKTDQSKFVAIVAERDDEGAPFLPSYYASRIFIDLSDASEFTTNFEKLVRWVFDKPVHQRPPLGHPPSFLSEASRPTLSTSPWARRAIDAARARPEHAIPATREYFQSLAEELGKLRLDHNSDPLDDAVVESIEAFLPYRNELIELFHALALYHDGEDTRDVLHQLFELLLPLTERPPELMTWRESDCDNFRFIVHELFLYAMAVLIHHQRYESADHLMRYQYFVAGRSESGKDAMVPYQFLRAGMYSFETRKVRLNLRRLSLRADLLHNRCTGVGVEFRELMQADFVLYLRDALICPGSRRWWSDTLLYTFRQFGPLELFARARSRRYFDRMKILLGIESPEDLNPFVARLQSGAEHPPRWEGESFDPAILGGFSELATSE